MPITLIPATGTIDAAIVDDNFGELENFLKENVTKAEFTGKFDKYRIRRYTGGKITSFNSGAKPLGPEGSSALTGTFENNWLAGAPESKYINWRENSLQEIIDGEYHADRSEGIRDDKATTYDHAMHHPFELLGYPGGSMYYDFQEQGFADPVSYYSANHGISVDGWPPSGPLDRFPKDECWSRWLTIPDAAGGVYVDEPCVAVVTANVFGNYFFTPCLRVSGVNANLVAGTHSTTIPPSTGSIDFLSFKGSGYTSYNDYMAATVGTPGHEIREGMQHSAHLRLGLFVDTNPIVWDDEFRNGDSFGSHNPLGSGHGFNPWIGSDPDGAYSTTRPDGVSKTRSWKKLVDLTYRVRQRHCYKVIGIVQLRGRRRYNFSLKFRPAMTFGHVRDEGGSAGVMFRSRYAELTDGITGAEHWQGPGWTPLNGPENPGWAWGFDTRTSSSSSPADKSARASYFYPGGDILATNLIESSALSVDFFYGQSLSSVSEFTRELVTHEDPAITPPTAPTG